MSFNLVDEKWIPCVLLDGSTDQFSLRDVFRQAKGIREIRDDSPLVTISLHRLLLAILHRNFGPRDFRQWEELWRAGDFDQQQLDAYFEQWHHRFDLFDAGRPFYQTGRMETKQPLPAATLFQQLAGGNNPTLFDHNLDRTPQLLGAPVAARGVIGYQAYSIGFGKSPDCWIGGQRRKTGYRSDAPLARGLSLLLRGDSLLQTLLLNLSEYRDDEADAPVWEQDGPEGLTVRDSPTGRLDLYTWQTRLLRLEPEAAPNGAACASWVHVAQGRKYSKEVEQRRGDPLKAYRRDEERGWLPLSPGEERALWRDSGALFELAHTDAPGREPPALNWAARAVAAECVARKHQYSLDVSGLCLEAGKAANVRLWRHERMPVPGEYLGDVELVGELRRSLQAAEEVGQAVRRTSWRVCTAFLSLSAERRPDREQVEHLLDHLAPERYYWSQLEVPFRQLLADLPADHLGGSARWRDALRAAAQSAFQRAAAALGPTMRAIRAVALHEGAFRGALNAILPKEVGDATA